MATPTPTPTPASRPPATVRSRRDHGQAIGLILIAVVLIGSIAIAVGRVANRLHDRATAQAAADAAALAGATSGRGSAGEVAERNGASLVSYVERRSGIDVTVTVVVRIDGETATARASTEP
ncbi:MAG: hypothetical protein ABIR32_15365 [Ilumatobacteraceae bacterium]